MNKTVFTVLLTLLVSAQSVFNPIWAENGKSIDFVIEDNGINLPQQALVMDQKLLVKQVGGNPEQDILFDASIRTLYIINHSQRSYYRIDQNVINKVASMVESISTMAETQQGVLGDLLETLGIGGQKEEQVISIRDSQQNLSVAELQCRIYQQFRNGRLESEVCISPRSNLALLGSHYNTLETFYSFGDDLLNRASSILSNMGIVIPNISKMDVDGLPILVNSIDHNVKTRVTHIQDQNTASENFIIPAGYAVTPIPFIG